MEEKETKASDEKSIQQTIDEGKQQKTQDTIKSKVEEILQQISKTKKNKQEKKLVK
jgi:hypothetical protein